MIQLKNKFLTGIVLCNNDFPTDEIVIKEVGYSICKPGYPSLIMKRNVHVLHYIFSGKGTVCGVPFEAPGGFLFSNNQDQFYSVDSDSEDWEQYWIMFDGTSAKKYLEVAGFKKEFHIFQTPYIDKAKTIFDNFMENINENRDISMKMLSVFFEMLSLNAEIYGHERKEIYSKNAYVQNTISTIHSMYDQPLTLNDIAKSVNISAKHLGRIFKEETGLAPMEYLNKHRIYSAAKLLSKTDFSISQIAISSGFYDPNYFSSVFKKHMNQTPSEYRKNTANQKS